MMQAIQIDAYGDADVLQLRQLPIPSPGQGEVLVKIQAAGVGPWDAWIRAGKSVLPQPLPLTPGSDIAGVVVATGPGVEGYAEGDAVFGVTNRRFTDGYAQYARVLADMIAIMPPGLTPPEAASIPVVAVTAWQMVHDFAGVQAGHRVLVLGGAGNVGRYAVQIARLAGAEVVATGSASAAATMRALGATEVIGKDMQGAEAYQGRFDAVIDTVGGAALRSAYALARNEGVVVSAVEKPDAGILAPRGVRSDFLLVQVRTPILEQLGRLVAAGSLAPLVGEVLPLADAQRAHRMLEGAPHKPGKIVLLP